MLVSKELTLNLIEWRNGDASAIEKILPVVYDELKRLAKYYLNNERANHTLQPTALVNETFLRLVGQNKVEWQDRAHFFGIAARLMREVLVDYARERIGSVKCGGRPANDLDAFDLIGIEQGIFKADASPETVAVDQ